MNILTFSQDQWTDALQTRAYMGYNINTFAEKLQKTGNPKRFGLVGDQFHYLKKDGTVKYILDLNAATQGPEVSTLSRVIYWIAKNIFCCCVDDDKFSHLGNLIHQEMGKVLLVKQQQEMEEMEEMEKAPVKQQLAQCKNLFSHLNPSSSSDVATFIQGIDSLATCLSAKRTDKQLLNDILNFKNEVRAACIDKKTKLLKGGYTEGNKRLNETDQQNLKASLKGIRTAALQKFFAKQLQDDREAIQSLEECFAVKKEEFKEQKEFLANYLIKLKKRNGEGKPISLPKYYHCTKTKDTVEKILNSYILFAQRVHGGCFVSTRPEFSNKYGQYCIALSERIEKTGTKNPGSKQVVYPWSTGDIKRAKFRDGWVKRKHFTDHNETNKQWLGFQRGAATVHIPADGSTPMGTDGIPLKCHEKFTSRKPLKGYADTSVAYIVGKNEDLSDLAKKHGIDCLTFAQEEALRSLIGMTFKMTFPSTWQGHNVWVGT